MSTIRVAIAGVGNCASSLVQGVEYYRDADPDDTVPGLMHVVLGGYHVGDLEFVAAFDVDAAKVGTDLGKAIFAGQNNTIRFAAVGDLGVTVQRGPTLDGLGNYYRETVEESPAEPVDVAPPSATSGPTCSSATCRSAPRRPSATTPRPASTPGVAFVNAIPVFIASDPEWARKFRDAGVPIVGDDIKSQVGSTIVHRSSPGCSRTGAWPSTTPTSSTSAATWTSRTCSSASASSRRRSRRPRPSPARSRHGVLDADDVHIGPSDHVPWLNDRKWAYIRMEGRNFGDVPLNLELKLEVWDSPNSAGVIIDAVRCAKLALDRGIGGPLLGPSAYFMKSPPVQYHDDEAHEMVEAFAAGDPGPVWPED